jgi:hypothetical protein
MANTTSQPDRQALCEKMRVLHEQGLSYAEIGAQFGMPRRAAHQLVNYEQYRERQRRYKEGPAYRARAERYQRQREDAGFREAQGYERAYQARPYARKLLPSSDGDPK